jgi:hypothetical protein
MTFNYAGLFTKMQQQERVEHVQRLIAGECRIADEQAELQAAWDELQAVPSYVERFVEEKEESVS